MDANKQAIGKEDKEDAKAAHGKDDLGQGRHGRYEGGRGSDQDRQAKDDKARAGKDEPSPPVTPPVEGSGDEEE